MGEHGGGHDDTHSKRCLKADANRDAIKKTVRRERERTRCPAPACGRRGLIILLMRVKKNESVENEITEKARARQKSNRCRAVIPRAKLNRFWQKVKSATPATAPAEKPRIRCSLSRNRSANDPPIKVAAEAASAISKTFIPATSTPRQSLL